MFVQLGQTSFFIEKQFIEKQFIEKSLLKKYFEIVGGLSDIIVTNEMIIWSHRKQKHYLENKTLFIKRGEIL